MFNGRAIYDSGVFNGVAEDVSDIISMISPAETPFLDALTAPAQEAQNVYHEWLEDQLAPNTIVSSSTIDTSDQNVGIHVNGNNGIGLYLQVGAVLKNKTTGEYLQVSATSANTLTLTRGFAGTSAATITAGDQLYVISEASLEGADVSVDTSRPRDRKYNYCQIFKKDIIISGTVQAVNQLGNITNEFDYQVTKKLTESIRDLEKAVIQSKLSGNTLGSATQYRTMRGVWDFISTNVTSTATLTPQVLDNIIQGAWDNGGADCDLIVCDANWKRYIDGFNESRVQVDQVTETFKRRTTFFEGTFGVQQVILSRWMPSNSLMVVSSKRVHVVPLRGRSYRAERVSKTGDSEKGMVYGEYTVELMNEEGMAKAYG